MIVFINSINPQNIWSTEQLRENISIQWTIFGISVTVFLFWYGFISKKVSSINGLEKAGTDEPLIKQLIDKYEFNQKCIETSEMFHSVLMISVNLVALVFSTILYVEKNEVTIINEIVSRFSFYCCVNTIAVLFFNILVLLAKKNKLLKKAYQKNWIEIDQIEEAIEEVFKKIDRIKKMRNFRKVKKQLK